MKRPRNLARMSDGARLGLAVLDELRRAHRSKARGEGSGVLHLSQNAHFEALGWPHYVDNLVTCPERHNHRSWNGIQLVIEPAFADDHFEIRKGDAA